MWQTPTIDVQKFTANEYIAACEWTKCQQKFHFQCMAGRSDGQYAVYTNSGTKLLGLSRNSPKYNYYYPCNAIHDVTVSCDVSPYNIFQQGYMYEIKNSYRYGLYEDSYTRTSVVIWRGEDNDDVHCMQAVGVESIPSTKNAS